VDDQEILNLAWHHQSPEYWHIFTGVKHTTNENLLTLHDPIPLVIITENSLTEYVNSAIPIKTILFEEVKDIRLRIVEKELQEDVWLFLVDIRLTDYSDKWSYWSLQPNFQEKRDIIIQCFIESYTKYKIPKNK
jgi:hypothetical protein